jgi:hypothetical protein
MSIHICRVAALALGASLLSACASETTNPEISTNPNSGEQQMQSTAGGHVGVHGMVLFGSGTERMYLSHIPLYDNPHNMQVIVEVKVNTGIPADQQLFATKQFTFNPRSAWSLDDLASGTLTSLQGTVYLGDFEAGGTPAFRNVKFDVKRVIFSRNMSASMSPNPGLDFIAVGTEAQPFLVHLIGPPPNYDQVLAVKLPTNSGLADGDLQTGTLVQIGTATSDKVTARPKPQSTVNAARVSDIVAGVGAPTTAIQIVSESSCMPGDQFFGPCPAAQ